MATILEMLKRFEKVDTDEMVFKAMQESEQDLNDLNLEQMYDGKTNTGENIHPTYLEDPYFKGNIKRAIGYSDWKDKITPNSRRQRFVPNLFINGFYHRSRRVVVQTNGEIFHGSGVSFAKDIDDKYDGINGLGGEYKRRFLTEYFIHPWRQQVLEATGLLMK